MPIFGFSKMQPGNENLPVDLLLVKTSDNLYEDIESMYEFLKTQYNIQNPSRFELPHETPEVIQRYREMMEVKNKTFKYTTLKDLYKEINPKLNIDPRIAKLDYREPEKIPKKPQEKHKDDYIAEERNKNNEYYYEYLLDDTKIINGTKVYKIRKKGLTKSYPFSIGGYMCIKSSIDENSWFDENSIIINSFLEENSQINNSFVKNVFKIFNSTINNSIIINNKNKDLERKRIISCIIKDSNISGLVTLLKLKINNCNFNGDFYLRDHNLGTIKDIGMYGQLSFIIDTLFLSPQSLHDDILEKYKVNVNKKIFSNIKFDEMFIIKDYQFLLNAIYDININPPEKRMIKSPRTMIDIYDKPQSKRDITRSKRKLKQFKNLDID